MGQLQWLSGFGRLSDAINCLALGSAPLPERVQDAYRKGLSQIEEWEVPTTAMWWEIEALKRELTIAPDTAGKGNIVVTLRVLSEEEAARAGRKMLVMWLDMAQAQIGSDEPREPASVHFLRLPLGA